MPGSRQHQKHTLYLEPGSLDTLREIYPKHTASEIVRHILSEHISTLYEKVESARPDIDLGASDEN